MFNKTSQRWQLIYESELYCLHLRHPFHKLFAKFLVIYERHNGKILQTDKFTNEQRRKRSQKLVPCSICFDSMKQDQLFDSADRRNVFTSFRINWRYEAPIILCTFSIMKLHVQMKFFNPLVLSYIF